MGCHITVRTHISCFGVVEEDTGCMRAILRETMTPWRAYFGHGDDGIPCCLPTGWLSNRVNMVPILELLGGWQQCLGAGTTASAIGR
eukprot:364595-Chlamydomonas_euryale.AAC.5